MTTDDVLAGMEVGEVLRRARRLLTPEGTQQ